MLVLHYMRDTFFLKMFEQFLLSQTREAFSTRFTYLVAALEYMSCMEALEIA
jgi:hypothetical protein